MLQPLPYYNFYYLNKTFHEKNSTLTRTESKKKQPKDLAVFWLQSFPKALFLNLHKANK
ncbi:hypothetical protein C426_0437 [Lactococcus garvieae DCC43]|uniref:Uncharacterized protein n=1 Tax=Lactococcus garvieae DCC43 TaxID=1231377 RepID=K2PPH1_9LACT|nr:hypothetical protein C426_0437 [Lactococcus garvieae DCC43]